jgi:putative transposase
MSQALSPSVNARYGLARVCRVWEVPRSTVYATKTRRTAGRPAQRRGPTPRWSDAALLEQIQEVLAAAPFVGEGHRKVWARLRVRQVRTSKARVLRLMRAAGLLAPTRVGHAHGPAAPAGTILTERPDEMWGTDATNCVTRGEGSATVFIAVDHCSAECMGIHAAKYGSRFEALEPIRQGVRTVFGGYAAAVAAGLALRHDHGSQYMRDHFQAELTFLGIASSPAFVREPEGNGCAERFIRTLKEPLLWVHTFDTVEELRLALLEFKARYNREWLIERHGHQTLAAGRAARKMSSRMRQSVSEICESPS